MTTTSSAPVRHRLLGCQPEPLGSYLKALGILRLVASQADPLATGFWDTDGFVLDTALDEDGIESFFLEGYQPTPVLSPWNNSSGFDSKSEDELRAIESSSDLRFQPYREAIAATRRLMVRDEWKQWAEELQKKNNRDEKKKKVALALLRSQLPEDCLSWIDAAAVLTDSNVIYPPILGSGGNDGRLEFSRNFHQRVLDVLGHTPKAATRRREWLRAALYDDEAKLPADGSPGQFDAGSAGGPNSSALGSAGSLLNPWDWVLLIEGSLLFAAGAARRLASDTSGRAAAPFTVASSPLGYGSAGSHESSRGELWLPLWSRPVSSREVRFLFAEGRLDWRERHARSGLEAAKAVASLGTDRGIESFSRHALLERNGLATVATPVGRIVVADRREKVAPLAALDGWLDRLRSSNLPAGVATALRATEAAEFALASGEGELLDVLIAASRLNRAVTRSPAARERVRRPLSMSGKDSQNWAHALLRSGIAHSCERELRLALSLASARDGSSSPGTGWGLRTLLTPHLDPAKPALVVGLGSRPIVDVLADAHARRVVEVVKSKRSAGDEEQVGVPTRFEYGTAPPLGDMAAWVAGDLDEDFLGVLVEACLVLDFRSRIDWPPPPDVEGFFPPELCLLAPFYGPQPSKAETGSTAPRPTETRPEEAGTNRFAAPLVPEADWPALLAAGRAAPVLDAALRRLRIAGLEPVVSIMHPSPDPATARRLGAALLMPQRRSTRARLLERICPEPIDDQHPASQKEGEA